MPILIIRSQATRAQIDEMLEELGIYIKLAVDVERQILAGGGRKHFESEQVLLEDGSLQSNIWGCDWEPIRRQITYESLINIRPRINNSMEILNSTICNQIDQIILNLLGHL